MNTRTVNTRTLIRRARRLLPLLMLALHLCCEAAQGADALKHLLGGL